MLLKYSPDEPLTILDLHNPSIHVSELLKVCLSNGVFKLLICERVGWDSYLQRKEGNTIPRE